MMKKISTTLLSLSILFVIGASLAYAQQPGSGGGGQSGSGGSPAVQPIAINFPNPFGTNTSLFSLLRTVINGIILPIGGVLAVLSFIYSGFLYVVAQGNETKLKTAHKALLYTTIGTAVLLGSWVLANAICQTIGQIGGPVCT
jgi:hypothetical protein